jgi:hypothetical protein
VLSPLGGEVLVVGGEAEGSAVSEMERVVGWLRGGGGGGEIRYARPCRPVKPFETICEVKAMSVLHVEHLMVLGRTADSFRCCSSLCLFEVEPWRRGVEMWCALSFK